MKSILYILVLLCFLIVSFFLLGCASMGPTFYVSVNSLSSSLASVNKRYIILPGNEGVSLNDLEFLEYMGYLKRALDIQGFTLAENFEDADVAVLLSYGITDPKESQYTASVPIIGTEKYIISNVYIPGSGFQPVYGSRTAVTGYNNVQRSYTTYFRYVEIIGIDLKKYLQSEELVQLWQTQITSTGSSSDLRYVFPVLIGAASDYIASDTKNTIELDLSENDPRVRSVKGLP